jgi:integrase
MSEDNNTRAPSGAKDSFEMFDNDTGLPEVTPGHFRRVEPREIQLPYIDIDKSSNGRNSLGMPIPADKQVELSRIRKTAQLKGGRASISKAGEIYINASGNRYGESTKPTMKRRYRQADNEFRVLAAIKLVGHISPYQVTAVDIHNYLTYKRNCGVSESEIEHMVAALRPMLEFCGNNAVAEAFARYPYLKPCKENERLPSMSNELVNKIIECAMAEEDDFVKLRSFAIPLWAISTGMRAKELKLCNVDDIDVSKPVWVATVLHPKGEKKYGKTRRVIIDPQMYPFLMRYFRARAQYVKDHGLTTGALFPGKESPTGHLAANTLREFKCYAEDKVGENFDLRICRRTYGQRMINYGVSIEWVSKLMGHASTLTTERYYGSLSNSMAVQGVANMIEQRSAMMNGEGAPMIGFGGFGNIGALVGGYC